MKRNSFGIQRRWHLQISGTSRHRAASPLLSGISRRRAASPPYEPPPPPDPPQPGSVKIHAKAIKFSGANTDYNPLYERALESKIEPPQWQKVPDQDAPISKPISYVKGTRATVKLDISGSPKIPPRSSLLVRVTPTAALWKQVFRKDTKGRFMKNAKGELVADDASGVHPYRITFTDPSKTIQITDWTHEDYEQLSFKTSLLPDTVRFDKLKITWKFEYRYNAKGPWRDAGTQTTEHETYITYDRSYKGFKPQNRPWIEVLRRACSYAHGAATITETSTQVTTSIYDSLEFRYYSYNSHSWYDNSEINLWDMLDDGWVDCMDGSNYYTILMRWLGINANQVKINENPAADQGFYYKPLRPISASDNHTVGWLVRNRTKRDSNWWNFHQVGILGSVQHGTFGSHIYDPVIKINEIVPRVPTNMIRDDYERAIFDPVPYQDPEDPKMNLTGTFPWHMETLVGKVN